MGSYIEEYVPINDINQYFLHYPAQSDTVLIFLHGGPGQSQAPLAYRSRPPVPVCSLVYYDQRGTGKTQRKNRSKPQDISLEVLLDDLKATIRYIKGRYETDKIILLGHSWGSILGTEYIKVYPDTVSAYIGMGQVIDMPAGEEAGYSRLKHLVEASGNQNDKTRLEKLGEYPHNLTKDSFTKSMMQFRRLQSKYGLAVNAMEIIKILMKSPVFSVLDIPVLIACTRISKNLFDMLIHYSLKDFTEYRLPVYYICGRNDWQVPSTLVEEYFGKITAPKKELFWIENAGHLPDVDNPEEFNKAIARICSEL